MERATSAAWTPRWATDVENGTGEPPAPDPNTNTCNQRTLGFALVHSFSNTTADETTAQWAGARSTAHVTYAAAPARNQSIKPQLSPTAAPNTRRAGSPRFVASTLRAAALIKRRCVPPWTRRCRRRR